MGVHQIVIEQTYSGYITRYSSPLSIFVFKVPYITHPAQNEIVWGSKKAAVQGKGAEPGYKVHLKSSGETYDFGLSEQPAGNDGSWSMEVDLSVWEGELSITARHVEAGNDWWSGIRTFFVLGTVNIDVPGSGAVTGVRGPISGSGAVASATVEIFKDLDHSFKIGQGVAGVNGQWSVTTFNRDMPPGPFTIVARQTVNGWPSEVSAPRSFKVRPPALTAVTVTYPTPTPTSIKFSGTGYTGATVEITILSGPGGTAPDPVPVAAGKWEATATDWPFGAYSLQVIQKVSDNANGWIESLPYTFSVNRVFPDPSGDYTKDYTPTFFGEGYTGATVWLYNEGGGTHPAPEALVSNGQWSSRASTEWGPVYNRPVSIRQRMNDQWSPNWVNLFVTIPPLAPVIDIVEEDGLSPRISGTCWANAVVELTFTDNVTKHPATVVGSHWTFQRAQPFAPEVTHTVTVTQTTAQQVSPAVQKTFTVYQPIPKPQITSPEEHAEVGRDMAVQGTDGMAGATMQLRDAQSGRALGDPKVLTADGEWSIDLTGLEFRKYTIDAQQKLNQRESERSEIRTFEVVLVPPVITVPMENGELPRTSTLEGWGMPQGRVEVWLEGVAEPLLTNIPVDPDGRWKGEVTLPVGAKTIRATQTFGTLKSKDSRLLKYNVVPAAPFIETPALNELVGRRVVVSGFGVPADTVKVRLGNATHTVLAQSPVLEDRTWSVTLMLDQPGGRCDLVAVASCDGFDSADSPERPVVLGTYLPSIDAPAAGTWVSDPVHFEGKGRQGVGQVMTWFNPDLKWSQNIPVNDSWQGGAAQSLPGGGNWCRFWQTLTDDADGATTSDWVDSERFEVWSAPPTKAR
jgi:hypothetical protein